MDLKLLKKILRFSPLQDLGDEAEQVILEHRQAAIHAGLEIVERAKSESRDFTAEEERQDEAINLYIDALGKELEVRTEKKPPQNVYIAGRKILSGENIMEKNLFLERKSLTYRDLFYEGRSEVTFERGGYNNFNDFLNVVTKKLETRALNETMGTDGGFSVPEYWAAEIWDSALEGSVFMDGVSMYPMKSNILYIPAWKSEDHTAGPVGGVQGEWLGELKTGTRVTPKMKFVKL